MRLFLHLKGRISIKYINMEHFYTNIHGWFTFPKLYTEMVNRFDTSTFVEVGTWKGKSAAYMAVEIANSNKNIKFYCIDPWVGQALDEKQNAYNCVEKQNNTLYEHFLTNIQPVKDYIIPIRDYSVNASKLFKDNSLDFIFIDASHDYESVKDDLNAWYPKLKQNGVISGHDYPTYPGVKKAVDEFILLNKLKLTVQEICWVVRDNPLKP